MLTLPDHTTRFIVLDILPTKDSTAIEQANTWFTALSRYGEVSQKKCRGFLTDRNCIDIIF